MDLGYFCLASLAAIAEQGAYFLMRYHYPTAVFQPNGTKINLLPWLQTQEQKLVETQVLLGAPSRQQVACRLISTPVPPAVAEERRRKAKLNASKHGKSLSKDYLSFLGWAVFVTNVPASMLSAQQVLTFYRIRWQVELLFKLWKSYCGLDHIPAFRSERTLTEFYAKLLVALLSSFLAAPLRFPDEALPFHEISPAQVRMILANFAQDIAANILDLAALRKVMLLLYNHIARFGFKQVRRKKPNICALLANMSVPVASS
jgi:hypothetical protein